MRKKKFCGSLWVVFACSVACADVRLPKLFGDDMVLQRDRPIVVWGWAEPGETVAVTLGTASGRATANALSEWRVELPPLHQGEGLTMTVAGKNTVTLKNIILGDIWVCSGQSNMEMITWHCNCLDDIKSAELPKIRRLKIDRLPSNYPEHDFTRTSWSGLWQPCTPESVKGFTAAGFFFAREVFQRTGVPIGLIDSSWGGTTIEPWIAPDGLGGIPELAASKKEYDTVMADYRVRLPVELDQMDAWVKAARASLAAHREIPTPPDLPAPAFWGKADTPRPYSLFFGMISPLLRCPIKGVLWYQGESNGSEGDIYYHKMRALIDGWRKLWGQGDFPFYYVQLPNYAADANTPVGGDGWALIRSAQTRVLTVPRTGMAVTIDIGDTIDIHPKDKQDVGLRLARWALNRDYGMKDLVPSGPLFKEMKIEGNKIRLSFDSVGSGLMVGKKSGVAPTVEDKNGKLARFAVAGEDKKWVWADATIDGNTVVVSSAAVASPVAVRYAFSANPLGANLYNKDGLPASPFRTDNW